MHRTDDDGHASNLFTDGDPSVPTRPTQLSAAVMNAHQEEIANVITGAGVALVKGTNNQLASVTMNLKTNQTASDCKKTFVAAEGALAVEVTGGDGGNNGGGGSNTNGGTAIKATGGSEQGGHQGGVAIEAYGGSGDDGAFAAISAIGGSGGFSSGRGVYAEGGGDGGDGGGIGVDVKGGAGGGAGGGVGLRVSAGDDGGGVYTNKAILASHGDVHVDDGKILVDNPGSVIATETEHEVGGGGEPAFANSWVNQDNSTYKKLHFWIDAVGGKHVQGYIKSGTGTIFTLPAGYRPSDDLMFPGTYNKDGAPASCVWSVAPGGGVALATDAGGSTKDQYAVSLHFR